MRKDTRDAAGLSGPWNDVDARMVAEEMVRSCTEGKWISRFNKNKGHEPRVIVGIVTNGSHEYINARIFIEDLEMALVNSGKVKFVADKVDRMEVLETRAKLGAETGADYMLQGSLNSVKNEMHGQYLMMFQVNLELVDMTTHEKAWTGQKKIRKIVKRPKYSL